MSVGLLAVLVVVCVIVAVVHEQPDVNRREECEDQRLNQSYKQLHEVKDREEARAVQEVFAAEDIAEKAHRKCKGPDDDRKDLDEADNQEDE